MYVNNEFGYSLKREFQQYFEAIGGTITAQERYLEKEDFSSELKKIKTSGAEVIFIAGYYSETAVIAKKARELGIDLPIVGTDGISSKEIIHLGWNAVEGILFAGLFHPDAFNTICCTGL